MRLLLLRSLGENHLDTGLDVRTRKRADVSRVSRGRKTLRRRELRRMLDAMANRSVGESFEWWADINWHQIEADVRAMRQRIITAAKAANPERGRNPQGLSSRSSSH